MNKIIDSKYDLRVTGDKVFRQKYAKISIDGCKIQAPIGEILAVTLFVNRKLILKYSSRIKEPRGFFCLMGSCQECLVLVDEKRVPACQVTVQQGIVVKTGIHQ